MFDFSSLEDGPIRRCDANDVFLDSTLALADAHAWWVVACLEPGEAWKDGLFGPAAFVGRQALVSETGKVSAHDIIAHACATAPRMEFAVGYLVIPVADSRVGPAVLAQHTPGTPGPVVDVIMDPLANGTLHPVLQLRAVPGTDLRRAAANLHCWILRRNAGAFDLPNLLRSAIVFDTNARSDFSIPLPAPIFHGDVIGLMRRGGGFTLASHLTTELEWLIEAWGAWQVALFVRREGGVSPTIEDPSLMSSGLLDRVRETMAAAEADLGIDGLLGMVKGHIEGVLQRTAIATSYLIKPELAARARALVVNALSGDRPIHLEHFAHAVSDRVRMAQLVANGEPLDSPWRHSPHPLDEAGAVGCMADIAGLSDPVPQAAGQTLRQDILSDPLALRAVVHLATRSSAKAQWGAVTAA